MERFVSFFLCLFALTVVVSHEINRLLSSRVDKESPQSLVGNGQVYVGDEFEHKITSSTEGIQRFRQRRALQYSTIIFINKAGMEVNVFYMDYYGSRRYYFSLRLNERLVIRSRVGTTWLAYDKSNSVGLLLNKKHNFLVYYNHLNNEVQVVVTAKPNVRLNPRDAFIPEKFIEVMVIADSTVVKKHGKGTEKYILTLMNAVNRLFQDKSFGMTMHIVVTRIKLLEKDPPNLQITKGAAKDSMRSACRYAGTLNYASDYDSNHFDFSVVLTRTRFGYSGYTPIYQMCNVQLGCTLVLERGFENAHVIAHEIGHSLGIDHDGENNGCKADGPKGALMGPTLWSRFDSYYWSKCSSKQIKDTVSYFTCLNDRPQKNITKYNTKLPGIHFTLDEQCAFYLGNHYKACKGFYFRWGCRFLYCAPRGTYSRRSCIRYTLAPMDGTECKYGNNWCVKGKCFPHGMFNYHPIHGGWSNWGSWGSCSSSCGIGIRRRVRKCDNPSPKYNGRECTGAGKDVKICNLKQCQIKRTSKDKRNEYCSSLGRGPLHWYAKSEMAAAVASIDGLNCTFDSVNNCSWIQDKDDNFDWEKHKGSTPSMGTGPRVDHTLSTIKGHYLFIEASDGQDEYTRLKGYKARLISPSISAPEVCFGFFYHMLGSHIGALNVYKKYENEEVLLWNRTKDVEDAWFYANISITNDKAFSIIIEGVRGTHYQGDIAIDDLSLTVGRCMDQTATDKTLCHITCTDASKTTFISGAVLPDAFSCHKDNRTDICLGGTCEKLGCDMQFGSNKTIDNCQVCGGDGSSCSLSEGNASVPLNSIDDETTLMLIPPGSTKLNFVIFAALDAVIGLRESASNQVYFPGKEQENRPESLYTSLLGCTYRFELIENSGAVIVESEGPSNGIVQLVISAAKQPRVNLQYRMFKSNSYYEWKSKKPGDCLGNCTEDQHVCIQMPSGSESENFNCPANSSDCSGDHCIARYSWYASDWSPCSTTCGTSVKTREVTCRKVNGNDIASGSIVADESKCSERKPIKAAYCRNPRCKKKVKRCREKSPLCGMFKSKGVCHYEIIKQLCCKTCA